MARVRNRRHRRRKAPNDESGAAQRRSNEVHNRRGEKVHEGVRIRYPDVRLRLAVGFCDVLIHDYRDEVIDIVYRTAEKTCRRSRSGRGGACLVGSIEDEGLAGSFLRRGRYVRWHKTIRSPDQRRFNLDQAVNAFVNRNHFPGPRLKQKPHLYISASKGELKANSYGSVVF
jgi:hypothetical protein